MSPVHLDSLGPLDELTPRQHDVGVDVVGRSGDPGGGLHAIGTPGDEGVPHPIAPVDDFIKGQPNVKRLGTSEVEISHLPATTEIWVLDPAKL